MDTIPGLPINQDTNLDTYLKHERCVFVRNPGDEPKLPKVAVKVQKVAEIFGAVGVRGISKMIRRKPLRRGIHNIDRSSRSEVVEGKHFLQYRGHRLAENQVYVGCGPFPVTVASKCL